MKPITDFLIEIRMDPRFQTLLKNLIEARPEIPPYPKVSEDEWKHASGQKRGYDLALSMFNINLDEEHENARPERTG